MTLFEEFVEAVKSGDLCRVESLLDTDNAFVNRADGSGATPLHYAALGGHKDVVKLLVKRGGDLNCVDGRFGATPGGWAVEYIRELGGYLAVELDDLAYAILHGDARWVKRLLDRFPALRNERDSKGRPFRDLAHASGNENIIELFRANS